MKSVELVKHKGKAVKYKWRTSREKLDDFDNSNSGAELVALIPLIFLLALSLFMC